MQVSNEARQDVALLGTCANARLSKDVMACLRRTVSLKGDCSFFPVLGAFDAQQRLDPVRPLEKLLTHVLQEARAQRAGTGERVCTFHEAIIWKVFETISGDMAVPDMTTAC